MFEEINAHRLAVQENIKKAFEIGFTGNDIEKAKQWQVGDEATDKHGVTYYIHALNAAGKPLWRKKKDGGCNPAYITRRMDINIYPSRTMSIIWFIPMGVR